MQIDKEQIIDMDVRHSADDGATAPSSADASGSGEAY